MKARAIKFQAEDKCETSRRRVGVRVLNAALHLAVKDVIFFRTARGEEVMRGGRQGWGESLSISELDAVRGSFGDILKGVFWKLSRLHLRTRRYESRALRPNVQRTREF